MITYKRTSKAEEPLLTIDDPIKNEYLRVDFDFEDNFIKGLLNTVVLWAEKELRMPIFRADYSVVINLTDRKEYDYSKIDPFLDFKHIQVNSIDSIVGIDIYGTELALVEDTDYSYKSSTNRLYFPTKVNLASYAIDHLVISGNFGFTKNNLPEDLKQGLYGLVAYFYENRGTNAPLPLEVVNALAPYKRWY